MSDSNVLKRRRRHVDADTSGNESDTDREDDRRRKGAPPPASGNTPPPESTSIKTFRRTWTSFAMIFGFVALVYYGQHTGVFLLVSFLQVQMFREIVKIGRKRREERRLPGFHYSHWYWFFVTLFFMYGKALMSQLVTIDFVRDHLQLVILYHTFISFNLFVFGFVAFVLSLQKGSYRYQFKQLGWCFLTILLIVVQSTFLMVNIFRGLIWFLFPAALIVTNDMTAYFFGRLFGRTPLISLSPKKTWEGFIGGWICTVAFSFFFAKVMASSDFLICPKKGFGFDDLSCTPDAMFVPYEKKVYPLIEGILINLGMQQYVIFQVCAFQFHATVLASFASVLAPFGGFFASGVKRAFKIKDFGDSIPGHGGITDRMDCQVLMGVFVYVYVTAFTRSNTIDVTYLLALFEVLSEIEKKEFLRTILAFPGVAEIAADMVGDAT